ncbi:TonB-dependent receptor family protein [Paraglaciecola psychrophila]|uniref:TonB-dependent receptor n=1 Tax=Paraglaciecola psychrophila 170 TaxID=1129794 RepID=K6ZN30_9ALTE|nr:TonB-dependent receptor [Paraglaciecola psychrophila]AGH43931.1 TonB-dependent receptor [Paraglaciecola psychrophila 170]GAC37331.1 iron complex outermembrane recepter protein [Paraglaciecola psychrophila 170]
MKKNILASTIALTLLANSAIAHSPKTADETVTIYGSATSAQAATGAAQYIGEEELAKFVYSDIQRVIRQIPGVSVQVEDGYGLRPNISIRGVATERSGRITLLEDNILIAPAPYSAPSAYYFPTIGRMSAIEVVKGPAAITQGPYTIGGALNMVSTPIPETRGGQVTLEAAQDATYRLHANFGDKLDNGFGYLIEAHQWQSDGFQDIDRSDINTGLDVTDFTAKLAYAPTNSAHSVELKLQMTEQGSEQSYLGLTDVDFNQKSTRRYGLSELDNISTEHSQVILRYGFEINSNLNFTATAYNNEHERNWFKTEGIDFDGSDNAQDFSRNSWANVISALNNNESLNGISTTQLQGILDGDIDTAQGSIQLRSNAREYYSRGVQFGLYWDQTIGEVKHQLEVGLRVHEDEEDRLQRNSTYQQVNGKLQLNDFGELGNAGNRIQEAQALALHVYDRIEFGDWVLTPGVRFEDIQQKRTRFNDGETRTFRDDRENDTQVVLPGLGALYKMDDNWTLVAGAHKGFTAPSNSPNVREEKAINYELGFRFANNTLNAEAIYFLSDYDNLLGECTASSGSNCEIGDAFNGDAATVQGIEFILKTALTEFNGIRVPLSITYTYINSEFDTDIADTAFFGDVSAGDSIPYIPENQGQISLGLEANNWSVYANAVYVDEVCVRASCAVFEKTDSSLTLDISGNYQVSNELKLFARIENLTDQQDIVSRQPYGARPNKTRTFSVGAQYSF